MEPTPLNRRGPKASSPGPQWALPGVPSTEPAPGADFYRHVLPTATPVLPELVVSARTDWRVPEDPGGDWFETAALPGGGLGIAMGDVHGTGIEAAAAAAQLRAVTAEALLAGCRPADVLERLERLAAHVPTAYGSSALVAVIEPDGEASMAHRGHAPPLAVTRAGVARTAPLEPSAPLRLGGEPACATAQLAPGDALVAYSDGALPLWSPGAGNGVEELRQRCTEAAANAAGGTSVLVPGSQDGDAFGLAGPWSPLFPAQGGRHDTITVMTVQRRDAPAALVAAVTPLDRPSPRPGQLDDWLRGVGASDHDVFTIHHAVREVLRRLDEDGQLPRPAPGDGHRAHLEAGLGPRGDVVVHIVPELEGTGDVELAGRVRSLDRARSLLTMLGLVEDAEVTLYADAPGMMLRHVLGRPVTFGPSHPEEPGQEPHGLDVRALPRSPGVSTLAVRGPLDRNTVDDLRLAIAAAGRSGERLVVDLNDVSLLGGAGVALLHEAVARGETRLVARHGTPAAAVMRMVALPFSDEV